MMIYVTSQFMPMLMLIIIEMQKYHQSSPHRAQSIRLFSLIHEVTHSQSPILNANSLDKFLNTCGLAYNQDLIKFMHGIDRQDKEMRQQYWGFCISRALERVPFRNEVQYLEMHRWIKMLLMGTYVDPLHNYELWDGENAKSQLEKDQKYAQIENTFGQLTLYISKIDAMILTSNIQQINACFSIINLFPGEKNEIIRKYEAILNASFLQSLQFALSLMNMPESVLIQLLKCLCYLYQAMKYEKIRKIVEQSFLVEPVTLQGLMQNINDKRPQIRYYTCSMMAIMVANVPVVATLVLSNKDLLVKISNGIALISQRQGLIYGLQFMIGVIRGFSTLSELDKQPNIDAMYVYMKFVVGKLGQLESVQCQAVCIKLVLEIVKAMDVSQDNLKLMKFIDNVFEGATKGTTQQKFRPVFQMTLEIAKYAIIYERKNVQKYILNDKSFQSYLKHILKPAHQEWQPFYSVLQIIHLLASSPQNCDILFKRDLIPCIFSLAQSRSGIVLFYLSEILLELIMNSLESEWKITYLYEKECLKIVGTLLGKWMARDQVLAGEYPLQGISYGNRQIFANALKALYYLNLETGNLSMLKKQCYIKNFSLYFINNFSAGLLSLFNVIPNRQYLTYLLKEQHSLGRNINAHQPPFIKLYKLLSSSIEHMTTTLRKRNEQSLQILRLVNNTRNQLHKCLYAMLSYNDLVVENVPIYLIYAASAQGKMERKRVYRLGWNQFRSLLWDFVKRAIGIDADFFKLYDKNTKLQIRSQDDYRRLLDRTLQDFHQSNFLIDVQITNIHERQQQRDPIPTGSMRINNEPRMEMPRFMSARMPQARDNSPYASRKTPPRNVSPTFGTPCRECRRTTTNRSQICNLCVQNRDFRL